MNDYGSEVTYVLSGAESSIKRDIFILRKNEEINVVSSMTVIWVVKILIKKIPT